MSNCTHQNVRISFDSGEVFCQGCGIVTEKPFLASGQCWGVPTRPTSGHGSRTHFYKRRTRFREKLRSLCGEGDASIPDNLLLSVRKEMHKYAVQPAKLTERFIVYSLRKHNLMRYGEQSKRIVELLGGVIPNPLKLTPDERKRLESRFDQCDRVWPRLQQQLYHKYGWLRLTFPNYTVMIFNFLLLEQLNQQAAIVKAQLLKTNELLHRCQFIWALFCHTLNWEQDYQPFIGNQLSDAQETKGHSRPYALHLKFGGAPYSTRKLYKVDPSCPKQPLHPQEHRLKERTARILRERAATLKPAVTAGYKRQRCKTKTANAERRIYTRRSMVYKKAKVRKRLESASGRKGPPIDLTVRKVFANGPNAGRRLGGLVQTVLVE